MAWARQQCTPLNSKCNVCTRRYRHAPCTPCIRTMTTNNVMDRATECVEHNRRCTEKASPSRSVSQLESVVQGVDGRVPRAKSRLRRAPRCRPRACSHRAGAMVAAIAARPRRRSCGRRGGAGSQGGGGDVALAQGLGLGHESAFQHLRQQPAERRRGHASIAETLLGGRRRSAVQCHRCGRPLRRALREQPQSLCASHQGVRVPSAGRPGAQFHHRVKLPQQLLAHNRSIPFKIGRLLCHCRRRRRRQRQSRAPRNGGHGKRRRPPGQGACGAGEAEAAAELAVGLAQLCGQGLLRLKLPAQLLGQCLRTLIREAQVLPQLAPLLLQIQEPPIALVDELLGLCALRLAEPERRLGNRPLPPTQEASLSNCNCATETEASESGSERASAPFAVDALVSQAQPIREHHCDQHDQLLTEHAPREDLRSTTPARVLPLQQLQSQALLRVLVQHVLLPLQTLVLHDCSDVAILPRHGPPLVEAHAAHCA
mmetsp:Transcript_85407/g.274893  ORF Transcript_85407/g.274893 Transcript_85407/m.274893 type:complete len:485 (-) Transcript_85407:2338-3792(-)